MKRVEEENDSKSISFKTAFYLVLGLHIIAAVGIIAFTQQAKAKTISSDKDFLKSEQYVGVEDVKEDVKENVKLETFYLVKKGDTLYSIARKNKTILNDLIKLNNIKDVNKIVIGQKLKLN